VFVLSDSGHESTVMIINRSKEIFSLARAKTIRTDWKLREKLCNSK